jgi:type III restriction enzyme
MRLKRYQDRVVAEVGTYLDALAKEWSAGSLKHAAKDAWEAVGVRHPFQCERRNGLGRDLPTFCIKVPTGGGKTLLATQILGDAYRRYLPERNGAGLVLWVVPSDQIYKDTLRNLRDRGHICRESLEFAVSRRIEVWEKQELARITPGQLASCLNILLVKLQGTNRQDRESLKFFRDSGGNIAQHFPAEDDPEAHRALRERIPNLDMIDANADTGVWLSKTSIANLVRLCEPVVILDEGHRATSQLARETIEGFNSRLVVELSATPAAEANTLVKVTGKELLDEQMIKLPINVQNTQQNSWMNVVTAARDKRLELAGKAEECFRAGQPLIRPIVLVQVERTGSDQRGGPYIHSEDVREYLSQRLGVPEQAIAVKTSEKDDIEGLDLMGEACPVEWIITKAALQEGWDCPFAYILVSLCSTGSQRAMTQLVGRILRQPQQTRTPVPELNESYVYCLRRRAADVIADVKHALESEGYEGDAASVTDRSGGGGAPAVRVARIRPEFTREYKRPFEGRIFLPRFCVKHGNEFEALDYFRHLLAKVEVADFAYDTIDWDLDAAMTAAKNQFYRITLGEETRGQETAAVVMEADDSVKAWLVANMGFEWFSAKQQRLIVEAVCARLSKYAGQLGLLKFALLDRIGSASGDKPGFVQRETDRLTENEFYRIHKAKRLGFFLECIEGRFEIPAEVRQRGTRKLRHDNDEEVARNLFDFVPDDSLNEYEKSVALFLDRQPQVLWWYRNIVGPGNFWVQGHKRNRIYPDFVVQRQKRQEEFPFATVFVVESKGKHLRETLDTRYKRDMAKVFGEIGREVRWQDLGEGFEKNRFRFQVFDESEWADRDWQGEAREALAQYG